MKSRGVSRRAVYYTNHKDNKPSAFVMLSNEQGFTLVQALWHLQLFVFLAFGCVFIFSIAEKANSFDGYHQFSQMEWKQTVQQLEEDLNRALAVRTVKKGGVLEFIREQGQVVTIESYQDMIRKRIDHSGHVPLLQKVKRLRVKTDQHTTLLEVTDLSGKIHEAILFTYKGVTPKS
ncbi:hypothetical protein BACPU_25180 [Bacillus pumilus]|nr:hypothetical protein BACPU_25180 [Bacillus pumilus]